MNQPTEQNFIRIILTEEQSQLLEAAGEKAFTIIARVMRTEQPEINLKWCIYVSPIDQQRARDASLVLCGKARAVRPRPAKDKIDLEAPPPHEPKLMAKPWSFI